MIVESRTVCNGDEVDDLVFMDGTTMKERLHMLCSNPKNYAGPGEDKHDAIIIAVLAEAAEMMKVDRYRRGAYEANFFEWCGDCGLEPPELSGDEPNRWRVSASADGGYWMIIFDDLGMLIAEHMPGGPLPSARWLWTRDGAVPGLQ